MNTPYYKLTPISDPPKEDGPYPVRVIDGKSWVLEYYSKKHGWLNIQPTNPHYNEFLWAAPCSSPGAVWVKLTTIDTFPPNDLDSYVIVKWKEWVNYEVETTDWKVARISRVILEGHCQGASEYWWLDESGTPAPLAEPVEGMRWQKLADAVQKLFDEKKKNPKNKGSGLQNAWNKVAVVLWDVKKLNQQPTSSTPSAREAELEREVERLRGLIKEAYNAGAIAGNGYYGHDNAGRDEALEEQWSDFKTENKI